MASASTKAEVWELAQHFAREIGASHLRITQGVESREPDFLWTIPDWAKRMFLETVFPHYDPCMRHCAESTEPYFYGQAFWDEQGDVPELRRMYDEEITEIGIRSIVAIPVHGVPVAGKSVVCWSFDVSASSFQKYFDTLETALRRASEAICSRLGELASLKKLEDSVLTERERECLLWLARGERFNQIAHRLGVRRVTVEFHLSNARKKLSARTKEQAVVRAIQSELIEP